MANSILNKKIIILRCSNGVMELLYSMLKSIIEVNDLTNDDVISLINSLNQEVVGYGFVHVDISDFLKKTQDLKLFSDLLGSAIEGAKNEGLITHVIEMQLKEFQKKIV